MRDNGTVTNREVELTDGELLVSKTDGNGRITFANQAFISISGYTEAELLGQPHNIVRHPDMPKAAFADLWTTVKSGRPWEGLVKNRCKNGDHYWVRANVTPLVEDGEVTGFISIRSKPTPDEVMAAERLYADMRDGRARDIILRHGSVIRMGWQEKARRLFNSVRGRLGLVFGGMLVLQILIGSVGMKGMDDAHDRMEHLNEEAVIHMRRLKNVSDAYAIFVVDASHKVRNGNFTWEEGTAAVEKARADIRRDWGAFVASPMDPDEIAVIEQTNPLLPAGDAVCTGPRAA